MFIRSICNNLILGAVALGLCTTALAGAFENYTGPYLGQNPPGDTAELFAPELFTVDMEPHDCPVFTADGMEMYWGLMEGGQDILYSRQEDGRWTEPELVDFHKQGGFNFTGAPCLSPDGAKLFFLTYTPPETYKIANTEKYKEYIWYVSNHNGQWSDPKPVDSAVNALSMHWQFSVTGDNGIYVKSDGHLRKSRHGHDHHLAPIVVGKDSLDGGADFMTPYVAPDESYILLAMRTEHARTNLYVSYRIDDSTWTSPISMGDAINTPGLDICPNVTPDGKYLFYLSNIAGYLRPYWIDAGIIDRLKPDFLQ